MGRTNRAAIIPIPIKWVEIREAICDNFDNAEDKHDLCRKLSKRLGFDALFKEEIINNSPPKTLVVKDGDFPSEVDPTQENS